MNIVVEGWAYLYDAGTGELISEGTTFTDPVGATRLLLEKASRHDPETHRWNPGKRKLVKFTNAFRITQLKAERDGLNARIAELEGV